MATLVLADSCTLTRHNIVSLLENRPGFVMVAAVANADDARKQVLMHRPDVVVIVGSTVNSEMCSAVARAATTRTNTRVVYVSAYENPLDAMAPGHSGISAILTRRNSFEDILATMMVVLHGGIFVTPPLSGTAGAPTGRTNAHGLSGREQEVLKGIASGRTTKEMARSMQLSPKTVETYRNRLMQKLDLRCVADLVQYAVRNNLD